MEPPIMYVLFGLNVFLCCALFWTFSSDVFMFFVWEVLSDLSSGTAGVTFPFLLSWSVFFDFESKRPFFALLSDVENFFFCFGWAKKKLFKGYISLNDFRHSDASLAWRSKTPTSFYPLKKARNSRDGNYSFEFRPLHAAHA